MRVEVSPPSPIDLVEREYDAARAAEYLERHPGVPEFPYDDGRELRMLLNDWSFEATIGGVRYLFRFFYGEVTDLSSVPRLARWIVDRLSMGDRPPFVHDILCRYVGRLPKGWLMERSASGGGWVASGRTFSNAETDAIFRALQAATGKRAFVRWASWLGVRLGPKKALRWLRRSS